MKSPPERVIQSRPVSPADRIADWMSTTPFVEPMSWKGTASRLWPGRSSTSAYPTMFSVRSRKTSPSVIDANSPETNTAPTRIFDDMAVSSKRERNTRTKQMFIQPELKLQRLPSKCQGRFLHMVFARSQARMAAQPGGGVHATEPARGCAAWYTRRRWSTEMCV